MSSIKIHSLFNHSSKSPVVFPRFVLELSGIRRLVVRIKAIETDDLITLQELVVSLVLPSPRHPLWQRVGQNLDFFKNGTTSGILEWWIIFGTWWDTSRRRRPFLLPPWRVSARWLNRTPSVFKGTAGSWWIDPSAVERIWHTQDSQGQILALA